MDLPQFYPELEPEFKNSERMWVIYEKTPIETSVLSILLELRSVGEGKHPVLVCTGYRVGIANLDSHDFSFPPVEVYATEELAKELSQWHPVSGLSEAEWKQAIGDRDDNKSLDSCELYRCCGIISDIRDLLVKCQEDSGLIERDVRTLRELMKEHECPLSNSERPLNLDKILGQLGLLDAFLA